MDDEERAAFEAVIKALKKERDDLVNGINRMQLTAVKWAKAFGGNTPLAIVAKGLRDLIGDRAIEPSSKEGRRMTANPPPIEGE